jgi:hypothetical protein
MPVVTSKIARIAAQNFIAGMKPVPARRVNAAADLGCRTPNGGFAPRFPRVFTSVIQVRYERGVYLPAEDLWLDPWDARPLAFVSHAHSDHIAPHEEIIVSERTARLMQARMPGERREHVLPFGETKEVRDMNVTLLPAGHIFGSAQFFLESEAGSLLYTGDFKLRPGRSAEATEWRRAQTLIMETTYGLPRYKLPPTDEVIAQIVAFCREALEENAVPVLLGYSLGKAQEILCSLAGAGLTPMLHGSVFRMTRIRALRCERRRGQGADLPAQRESLGDAGEDPAEARGDDQRLGDRSEFQIPLSDGCGVPVIRPRRLHRSAPLCGTGETRARAHVARFRCGIRAGSARTRRGSVGFERGKPARVDAAGAEGRASARPRTCRSMSLRALSFRVRAVCRAGRSDCRYTGEACEGAAAGGLPALVRPCAAADRRSIFDRQSVCAK